VPALSPAAWPYVPLPAGDWGQRLLRSRDGVGEDGWPRQGLEPEDRQHLTVLQLAGEHEHEPEWAPAQHSMGDSVRAGMTKGQHSAVQ